MQTAIPPTVMVINDDATQLHLTVAWIKKDGWRLLACQSAEEALGLLRTGVGVDVIVTDLHMPRIDGWRFCRLLRSPEYAAFNHIPILVLSATFSGADAEQMSTALGANAFLAIPYDPAVLRAHVRELLAGHAPQAPLHALIVEDSHISPTLPRTWNPMGIQSMCAHGRSGTAAAAAGYPCTRHSGLSLARHDWRPTPRGMHPPRETHCGHHDDHRPYTRIGPPLHAPGSLWVYPEAL
jgi:CheY-like chemotaxis protein